MTAPWHPEHPVDADLAGRLIRTVLPEGDEPELVGRGWDVDVWRSGELAFRFPRRALGAQCVENEIRLLPALAGRLPLPIPAPALIGKPTLEFPHVWFGHAFLPGITADRARLSNQRRCQLARPIAEFLRALHAIPVDEMRALGAQPDALRRDLRVVRERAEDRLPALERSRFRDRIPRLRTGLKRVPPGATSPDILIHGDLYARHLLLEDGGLAGVIDWGDLCLGDRAVDLDVVYAFLPPEARAAFYAVYGAVDADVRERARYFALCRHAIALIAYALDVADTPLLDEAEHALELSLS